MASSQVAHSDVTNSLFGNLAFWLSSTIPQRSRFKELIQANGGSVVNLERDATYRLVDHTKKDLPYDTYSYQFVERSIRKGKLEDPETYRAGPSINRVRPVGSSQIRPKAHRLPFSARDDQILYDWVKPFEEKGGPFRGNVIYQQLEAKYPRHTYQSWRSRYLDKVRDLPRPVTQNDSRTSPPELDRERVEPHHPPSQQTKQTSTQKIYDKFTNFDKKKLLDEADYVLQVEPSSEDDAWAKFAEANPEHSADEWKTYFHNFVRPEHNARQRRQKSPVYANNNSPAKAGGTASSASTNIVSETGQAGQSQSTRQARQSQADGGSVEVVVHKSRERDEPIEESGEADGVSLKRKRRRTADDVDDMAAKDTVSPSSKRRATDYVRDTSSASKSGQAATVITRHQPGRSQVSPKIRSPDKTTKRPVFVDHAYEVSKEPASDTESKEDQFETAPQFQSLQDRNDVLAREEDSYPAGLLDTTLPGFPDHENESDGDENDAANFKELDDWIESRVSREEVADKIQVIEALRCTTMDTTLTDQVLPYLKAGKGIPTNMRGVWTAEDDKCIEGNDARIIEQLYKKHGEELANSRVGYLGERRAAVTDAPQ